jgi:hypothetical protein
MQIAFKKLAAPLLIVLFVSCSDKIINEDTDKPDSGTGKNINLSINVPRNSITTYSSEAGTEDENHIDTLFVNVLEDNVLKASKKFYGSSLQTVSGTNDSIVNVAFEIDNLTGGAITAEVFANRTGIIPVTTEIPLPDKNDRLTWFMMSGSGTLNFSGTAYYGTIKVMRNVAKLRVRITKHPACIPANLVIMYNDIKIETQQVPDRTQLMAPPPISTPPGLSYITNYASHTGASLRPETPIASFNGGQIDSLYLNENYLEDSDYNASNMTQVKITLPSQAPGMPVKSTEYTYQLFSEGSYRIKRNFIYILDIKVAGQSLDPLITLDIVPWNDVNVKGDINGGFLNLDRSVVNMTPVSTQNDPQTVIFNTDHSSVTLDWSRINPDHHIDTSVVHIQGANGNINFFWNGGGAPDYSFRDTVYVFAGNIAKAVEIVYNVPAGNFGNWVGTFHRWNQTGERIIKMRNTGEWTATVTQGAGFIVLDAAGTSDPNWGSSSAALGNDSGFDTNYPVNGTATALSGNGIIYFRVGMKSKLAYIGAMPRYGLIEVTTDEGTKKIYVRQGEEADYVMRPEDPNPANTNNPRSYAMKFAPFNLADPLRGTGGADMANHNRMPYGDAVFNSNKFVDYPSQAGYFFPWNSTGTYYASLGYDRAYHPANPTGTITNMLVDCGPATWDRTLESCPAGYRHPKDSLQSPVTSEIRQSWFYTPNSNLDTESVQTGGNLDNSLWGFYADGFFDRLKVVSSPNGVDSAAVSYNASDLAAISNTRVAYTGRLIYNPTTYASLFLPAAGARNGTLNNLGPLKSSGQRGMYWTSTNGVPPWMGNGSEWAVAFCFTQTSFYGLYSLNETVLPSGISIRCVKYDFGLPGSM